MKFLLLALALTLTCLAPQSQAQAPETDYYDSYSAYFYPDEESSNLTEAFLDDDVIGSGATAFGGEEDPFVLVSENVLNDLGSATDLESIQAMLGIETVEPKSSHPLFYGVGEDDLRLRSKKNDRFISNPEQAHCQPELQPVDLGLTSASGITYYPTCVRVLRCGGCCHKSEIFSCQPVASEKVVVKVLKLTPQTRSNSLRTRSRRRRTSVKVQYNNINVTIEEHTQCNCMCKLKESECNLDVHRYDQHYCSCICKNKDEEDKCKKKSSHVWNKKTCECLCRKTILCSSSDTFDHNTCSCKALEISAPWNVFSRRSHLGEVPLSHRKPVAVPVF